MTGCRHCRRPRCRHGNGWWAVLVLLTFPVWLVLWGGRTIHDRWGRRGVWIYVGALLIAAALHNLFGAATPPASPPPVQVVVITVTSTVNP